MKTPNALPVEMEEIINNQLKSAGSPEECLKRAYDLLSLRYHGNRWKIVLMFWELFNFDTRKLWSKKGFLYCTSINYLMKILLIRSGCFKEGDIMTKWSLTWNFFPHQYLRVRIHPDKYINVDIWAKIFGIQFGDYAHGFHQSTK
ncbi:MAG: hypothetical protein NTY61_01950 [Candidatus Parcubacteria bacterium]|nr:hypothetical protein [Candidatus Parcubacteria bacterium]